jgi:hypothetical protein
VKLELSWSGNDDGKARFYVPADDVWKVTLTATMAIDESGQLSFTADGDRAAPPALPFDHSIPVRCDAQRATTRDGATVIEAIVRLDLGSLARSVRWRRAIVTLRVKPERGYGSKVSVMVIPARHRRLATALTILAGVPLAAFLMALWVHFGLQKEALPLTTIPPALGNPLILGLVNRFGLPKLGVFHSLRRSLATVVLGPLVAVALARFGFVSLRNDTGAALFKWLAKDKAAMVGRLLDDRWGDLNFSTAPLLHTCVDGPPLYMGEARCPDVDRAGWEQWLPLLSARVRCRAQPTTLPIDLVETCNLQRGGVCVVDPLDACLPQSGLQLRLRYDTIRSRTTKKSFCSETSQSGDRSSSYVDARLPFVPPYEQAESSFQQLCIRDFTGVATWTSAQPSGPFELRALVSKPVDRVVVPQPAGTSAVVTLHDTGGGRVSTLTLASELSIACFEVPALRFRGASVRRAELRKDGLTTTFDTASGGAHIWLAYPAGGVDCQEKVPPRGGSELVATLDRIPDVDATLTLPPALTPKTIMLSVADKQLGVITCPAAEGAALVIERTASVLSGALALVNGSRWTPSPGPAAPAWVCRLQTTTGSLQGTLGGTPASYDADARRVDHPAACQYKYLGSDDRVHDCRSCPKAPATPCRDRQGYTKQRLCKDDC